QRLCIARALLKKPKILILDDSTSAVDTKTDKLIRAAFHNEIPDTTKIIIAQRVASVQESDMILVMDNGRIMASGTHEELLATCDEYRSIYESQTRNQAKPEELAAAEQAATESSAAEPAETVTVTVTMPTADTTAADTKAADTKEGEAR
ncbi:MAG: ABC transporter ATP-binding protein, partial [Bifidobacterium breve]|nr:ABC transporter ATP-binding protein [Bifidobacterium breve]